MHVDLPRLIDARIVSFHLLGSSFLEGEFLFIQGTLVLVYLLIKYMKKLLDSDWLREVQFKRNTNAKSVTPVQITHRNSGL